MLRFLPLFLLVALLTVTYSARGQIETLWENLKLSGSPVVTELSSADYLKKIYTSGGSFDPNAQTGVWFNKKVSVPTNDLAQELNRQPLAMVLGDNTAEKWIDVDLTTQTLRAYEGNTPVYTFKISSGLPWLPTVTGEFHIWAKIRSARMTGGEVQNGTFYDLPNVPFIEYFYGGYGIHGAYWNHEIGKPRSHGCINLSVADSETLFNWTSPTLPANQWADYHIGSDVGTRVEIHGVTPTNIN